jgi:hypothetical protein
LFFFFVAGLFGDVWISRILPQPKSSVFFSAGKFFRERCGEGDEEKAVLSALSVSYPLDVNHFFNHQILRTFFCRIFFYTRRSANNACNPVSLPL